MRDHKHRSFSDCQSGKISTILNITFVGPLNKKLRIHVVFKHVKKKKIKAEEEELGNEAIVVRGLFM